MLGRTLTILDAALNTAIVIAILVAVFGTIAIVYVVYTIKKSPRKESEDKTKSFTPDNPTDSSYKTLHFSTRTESAPEIQREEPKSTINVPTTDVSDRQITARAKAASTKPHSSAKVPQSRQPKNSESKQANKNLDTVSQLSKIEKVKSFSSLYQNLIRDAKCGYDIVKATSPEDTEFYSPVFSLDSYKTYRKEDYFVTHQLTVEKLVAEYSECQKIYQRNVDTILSHLKLHRTAPESILASGVEEKEFRAIEEKLIRPYAKTAEKPFHVNYSLIIHYQNLEKRIDFTYEDLQEFLKNKRVAPQKKSSNSLQSAGRESSPAPKLKETAPTASRSRTISQPKPELNAFQLKTEMERKAQAEEARQKTLAEKEAIYQRYLQTKAEHEAVEKKRQRIQEEEKRKYLEEQKKIQASKKDYLDYLNSIDDLSVRNNTWARLSEDERGVIIDFGREIRRTNPEYVPQNSRYSFFYRNPNAPEVTFWFAKEKGKFILQIKTATGNTISVLARADQVQFMVDKVTEAISESKKLEEKKPEPDAANLEEAPTIKERVIEEKAASKSPAPSFVAPASRTRFYARQSAEAKGIIDQTIAYLSDSFVSNNAKDTFSFSNQNTKKGQEKAILFWFSEKSDGMLFSLRVMDGKSDISSIEASSFAAIRPFIDSALGKSAAASPIIQEKSKQQPAPKAIEQSAAIVPTAPKPTTKAKAVAQPVAKKAQSTKLSKSKAISITPEELWEKPYFYLTEFIAAFRLGKVVNTDFIERNCLEHGFKYISGNGAAYQRKYNAFEDAIYENDIANKNLKRYYYSNPYNSNAYTYAINRLKDQLRIIDLGKGEFITLLGMKEDYGLNPLSLLKAKALIESYVERHPFFTLEQIRREFEGKKVSNLTDDDRIMAQFVHAALKRSPSYVVKDEDYGHYIYSTHVSAVKFKEFFKYILGKEPVMSIYDIQNKVEELFEVNYNLDQIGKDASESGYFYSPEMEKLYKHKKDYYKEISEE